MASREAERSYERSLAEAHAGSSFSVPGWCLACEGPRDFDVDWSATTGSSGATTPRWRETLDCPSCGLKNRQRLVARALIETVGGVSDGGQIYLTEQLGALHAWTLRQLLGHVVIGSEYLDPTAVSGEVIGGLRHEDLERLSFDDAALDIVLSCDVLEHVVHPRAAIAELARTLRPGGMLLLTVPFRPVDDHNTTLASVDQRGVVSHHQPPRYHGNPLSPDGALVFTLFGWELLDQLRSAGFEDVVINLRWSAEHGHLGNVFFISARRSALGVQD